MNLIINKTKIILLTYVISICNYCYSESEVPNRDWLFEVLEQIQDKFPFSTHEKENVENNKIIFSEVDAIIEETLKAYPKDIPLRISCIRLLYIQGNHYLYRDLPVLAQKKLLNAKALCEKDLSPLSQSANEICQELVKVDGHLPSFYAMILRLLGKAYVYPPDPHNQLQREEGEVLLKQALKLREYIDSQSEDKRFHDTLDNNDRLGNTHIFKRDLAYALFIRGDLNQAEKIFLELKKVDDPLNQLMCLKRLLAIYHQRGQMGATLVERQEHYKRAIETVVEMISLIETNPPIYRISSLLTQIGQFYFDPQNPFRDILLSRQFFEQANQTCLDELKLISTSVHQGLSNVYQEIAILEAKQSKQDEWDYGETSSTTYLKDLGEKWERQVTAYEQLGDLYFEQQKFVIATTLYSNGLSILRKISAPPENPLWFRLTQKMEQVEQAVSPYHPQNLSAYSENLYNYRNRLEMMRQQVKRMIGHSTTEEIFAYVTSEYKQLIQLIIKNITAYESTPQFTLVCGGSMSWNVTTPYSDVELAFLIDPKTSEEEKAAIENLSILLTLRLSAIGETPAGYLKLNSLSWLNPDAGPSPRGIMLDPFQLANTQKYFIGTPTELVSLQKEGLFRLPHLRFSFIHVSLISGDPSLLNQYEEKLEEAFGPEEREIFSSDQLKRDLTRWEIKLYQDISGERCSIKHDLYRALDTVLYDLGFRFWIREAKTPWELFKALETNGYINHEMALKGLEVLDLIGQMRIQAYLGAECQSEWIDPAWRKIAPIREFLRALHEHVKPLILDLKAENELSLDSIDSVVQKLASDKKFYGSNHPIVSKSHARLGTILANNGHYHEAIYEFQEAIRIDSIIYGAGHACLASYLQQLKYCQAKIDSQSIRFFTPCHNECKEKELAALHPLHKARDLENQGMLALEQGDLTRANNLFTLSKIIFASHYKDRHTHD